MAYHANDRSIRVMEKLGLTFKKAIDRDRTVLACQATGNSDNAWARSRLVENRSLKKPVRYSHGV